VLGAAVGGLFGSGVLRTGRLLLFLLVVIEEECSPKSNWKSGGGMRESRWCTRLLDEASVPRTARSALRERRFGVEVRDLGWNVCGISGESVREGAL
jgi:hypothetical protein